MRQRTFLGKAILLLYFTAALGHPSGAQSYNCNFKQPLFLIHFGQGENIQDINASLPPEYDRVFTSCPIDGHYSFTSYTSDCFHRDWFTLPEDHTPGDRNGNMMLVNASENGGVFLSTTIRGLSGNTAYEFAAWLMNVCKRRDVRIPLPPNITILLKTPAGREVARFETGQLLHTDTPDWKRFAGIFTMPASETVLLLTMQNHTIGGRGNDFALDDITIRECIKTPVTAAPKKVAPPLVKRQAPPVKESAKKGPLTPVKTSPPVSVVTKRDSNLPVARTPVVRVKEDIVAPVPPILAARANPLVKQIQTGAGEIKFDLYDNGEIDGDTVSVYHNNNLIVSGAKLSQKPITFRLTLDPEHPHHELIMVANNLGSIPPNTSLMIVTANSKRYEVFISSTKQKNAKVVIHLQE